MKHPRILLLAILLMIAIIFINVNHPSINCDFATRVFLKYHYGTKDINTQIVDKNDFEFLKNTLAGRSYKDKPSCGFTTDIAITLTNGKQSITFCPACDDCPVLRVNKTDRYIAISEKKRKQLDAILSKYGVIFPCI